MAITSGAVGPPRPRQLANERLVSEIRVLHAQSFGSYGSPRIHAAFKRQDRRIGRERVRRLMQEHRIVGRHRKKRCRTTDSNHVLPIVPNLLQQNFACATPNTVWLADISYLPTQEGFLYFAAMKDLCTQKIVGWSMSKTIDAQLTIGLDHGDRPPAALCGADCAFRPRQSGSEGE